MGKGCTARTRVGKASELASGMGVGATTRALVWPTVAAGLGAGTVPLASARAPGPSRCHEQPGMRGHGMTCMACTTCPANLPRRQTGRIKKDNVSDICRWTTGASDERWGEAHCLMPVWKATCRSVSVANAWAGESIQSRSLTSSRGVEKRPGYHKARVQGQTVGVRLHVVRQPIGQDAHHPF